MDSCPTCGQDWEDAPVVPEHQHDFVGDQDYCVGYPGCRLTWGEYRRMAH